MKATAAPTNARRSQPFFYAAALLGALVLTSCGGGGGGGTDSAPVATPTTPPAATTATLRGVAANGLPFAGALVSVYDSAGTVVGTTTVAADGTYALTIPATAKAPLVLEAALGNTTLVSTIAETRDTSVNITPLTNVIAARLSPDGNPLTLKQNSATVTPTALAAKVAELRSIIAPLTSVVGDTVDPLNGTFAASGPGHDQVLASLDIQINPAGPVSNIEITVRGGTVAPVNTIFTSADPIITPLPGVDAATLPPVGIDQMVTDLVARMTTCYSLPLEQRVRGATATSTLLVGTSADIIAPQCRTLFFGDDPATYLGNGLRVGRDAGGNGAFTGIFRANATGVVFDQGEFKFLRANADHDVVFTSRNVGRQGHEAFDELDARIVNGQLKLIGNQYIYNARVRPAMEDREFLNQPLANYVNTGYDLFADNALDNAGNPVFTKVVFTSPSGQVFTAQPNAGRSQMTLVRPDGTLSGSSIIYLAAKFRNPATTGNPGPLDTGLLFASPQLTDAELVRTPSLGVWRVEFFHIDPAKANVIQSYRTLTRAPTLAEAENKPIAQFTDAAKADLRARGNAQFGVIAFGTPSATAPNRFDVGTRAAADYWTVPPSAVPPTLVQVFGAGPDPDGAGPLGRPSFNDSATVTPSARRTAIACTGLGNADTHCDNSTGVNQYAQGSFVSVLQLFTMSKNQEELGKILAFYFILPR